MLKEYLLVSDVNQNKLSEIYDLLLKCYNEKEWNRLHAMTIKRLARVNGN